MLLYKRNLVNIISRETRVPMKEVRKILDALGDSILDTVLSGRDVTFRGFGTFFYTGVRIYTQKMTPRQWEIYKSNKRRRVHVRFLPSSNLTNRVNGRIKYMLRKQNGDHDIPSQSPPSQG